MTTLLFFYGKFLLASFFLLALYWGVLRGRASYKQSRLYLLSLPVFSLLMSVPRFEVYRPQPTVVEVEAEAAEISVTYEIPSVLPAVKAVSSAYIDGLHYELYICMGIAFVSLVLLMLSLFYIIKMYRLRGQVKAVPLKEGCRVVRLAVVDTPFSFMDTIFLPQGMTARAEDYILRHEQSHVRHRHYIDVWLIELLTRLLWFNPVLWMSRNELRNVHEYEADRDVTLSGVDLKAYQSLLMEYSMADTVLVANGFTNSFVRRRFIEMRRTSWGTLGRVGHGAFAAFFLVLLASFTMKVGEPEVVVKQKQPSASPILILKPSSPTLIHNGEEEELVGMKEKTPEEVIPIEDAEVLQSDNASDDKDESRMASLPIEVENLFPLNTSKRITYSGYYIKRTAEATYLVCVATPESDDEVYHLGSHVNTCIVDVEHGVYYRARGAVPADAWEKDFHVTGMKGKTIALRIVFPPMPDDVEHIRIFGVGDWNLRGQQFRMKDIEEK